jgi:ATP-dependent Clp protease protease subunit
MNEELTTIYNDDGTMKTKEEFLQTVENFYDKACTSCGEDILDELTNPDKQVDVEATIGTFDFYERHLYVSEEITSLMANQITELIYFWNRIDNINNIPKEARVPIKMFINSPGGELEAVFSIIGAMETSTTPIYTITTGTSYSGGFFIGICGTKRFAFPYSTFLFHEGSSGDMGDAHKFLQRVDFYRAQLDSLKSVTINHTKISAEEYDKHFKDDWCLNCTEALNFGVIDKVINTIDDLFEEENEEIIIEENRSEDNNE